MKPAGTRWLPLGHVPWWTNTSANTLSYGKRGIGINIQNIPRDDKTIKGLIKPTNDLFIFADYEAIEWRLLAYYVATKANDFSLTMELNAGLDPHVETASKVLGLDPAEITDEQRNIGKTLNYSIIYLGGPRTVSKQLQISWPEAEKLIHRFHAGRPGVHKLLAFFELKLYTTGFNVPMSEARRKREGCHDWRWKTLLEEAVKERGAYVETIAGRRRRPLKPHLALNSVLQGSAAEITKNAMIVQDKALKEKGTKSWWALNVHDELIWDVVEEEKEWFLANIPTWMAYPDVKIVNMPVELATSYTTWADKEEV